MLTFKLYLMLFIYFRTKKRRMRSYLFLLYQLWLCRSDYEIGGCYAHTESFEKTDGTDDVASKQQSTFVLKYDWLPHLIRSVPEFAELYPRQTLQVDSDQVSETGTIVFNTTFLAGFWMSLNRPTISRPCWLDSLLSQHVCLQKLTCDPRYHWHHTAIMANTEISAWLLTIIGHKLSRQLMIMWWWSRWRISTLGRINTLNARATSCLSSKCRGNIL